MFVQRSQCDRKVQSISALEYESWIFYKVVMHGNNGNQELGKKLGKNKILIDLFARNSFNVLVPF